MLVVVKGAGDIATGIAIRLFRSGLDVVMTELDEPTAIRRSVAFSEAVRLGETKVEDVTARRAESPSEALEILQNGQIPVLADPGASCVGELHPDAVVDAVLAKRNTGTHIDGAPAVVGVGPGFTAGKDCHAVVETKRGHSLGRVIRKGSAAPNTGIPGYIAGVGQERVLRAPTDGIIEPLKDIGDHVDAQETVAVVEGAPMIASISGVLRGMLPAGITVHKGMKAGDIDPRDDPSYCQTVSDKALAVGGGVLEAVLSLSNKCGRPKEGPA